MKYRSVYTSLYRSKNFNYEVLRENLSYLLGIPAKNLRSIYRNMRDVAIVYTVTHKFFVIPFSQRHKFVYVQLYGKG